MRGFSGFGNSPLEKGYKPPNVAHDTSLDSEVKAKYNPETKTTTMSGGTYGVLSHKELGKIERHETKHHHQVSKRGATGHRKKNDLDFEKWFKTKVDFKKTAKMSKGKYKNLRDTLRSKWGEEQYNVPGSNEYEAVQAETKSSPGLLRKS